MKTISSPFELEPPVEMECSNNHRFWVDPCGEENLEWNETNKSLVAVCPECGEREEKSHSNTHIDENRRSGAV